MYLAWDLIYLGIGLAVGSVWILALSIPVVVYVHYVDIRKEERLLELTPI